MECNFSLIRVTGYHENSYSFLPTDFHSIAGEGMLLVKRSYQRKHILQMIIEIIDVRQAIDVMSLCLY